MLKLLLSTLLLALLPAHNRLQQQPPAQTNTSAADAKIQVALLLDTSNSMDGLIDQAKAQLWKMVNKLAAATRQDQNVVLEIALFEYGNDNLSKRSGYIRLVQPLGTDLDGLSEKLFALRTKGGDEYCGWVIQEALEQVRWSESPGDLRVIVIAGNEPFTQGPVDFRNSCKTAQGRDILVNTIHCGDFETGVSTGWKEGAEIGLGKYLIIDTDARVVHIATPYDSAMLQLNYRLNATYIGIGSHGAEMKMRQEVQDKNAATYGAANAAQRASAKAKKSYDNRSWDLVDAAEADAEFVEKLKDEDLPESLKGKSKTEIQQEVERLRAERAAIRQELLELEKQMNAWLLEERKKTAETETLDNALIETVAQQARAKGFGF